jgi:hypothetical protein
MTNEQLTAAVLKLCQGMDTLGRDLTEVRTFLLGPPPPPQPPPLTAPVTVPPAGGTGPTLAPPSSAVPIHAYRSRPRPRNSLRGC